MIVYLGKVLPFLFAIAHYTQSISALITKISSYHQSKEDIKKELKWVIQAKQDPKFFGPIYERYYDQIFVYINKRIDDYDETADITSKVFLKCLYNIHKFTFQGVPFSAWLYRITINEINIYYRQQKAIPRTVSIDEPNIDNLLPILDNTSHSIDKFILVPVLLEQLTPKELHFIELRFFEKKSFKEMAYLLKLTEVNAKVKTYRIIKKLKKLSEEITFK